MAKMKPEEPSNASGARPTIEAELAEFSRRIRDVLGEFEFVNAGVTRGNRVHPEAWLRLSSAVNGLSDKMRDINDLNNTRPVEEEFEVDEVDWDDLSPMECALKVVEIESSREGKECADETLRTLFLEGYQDLSDTEQRSIRTMLTDRITLLLKDNSEETSLASLMTARRLNDLVHEAKPSKTNER